MGKTFYQFKRTKVNKQENCCKNCGKVLKRKVREDGCCCNSCSVEYALKYKDKEKLVRGFNTVPYNAYTSNPLQNFYRKYSDRRQ